ncbi:reverse transcriptase domain-containing protein [Planctomicrobium sp. SH661]|uniref:reverse transcriptase domain-containing protein n=1 Tax=Planctomicrobium sp. SH661 TaxID=3448124 RepID=UPI003F5C25B7
MTFLSDSYLQRPVRKQLELGAKAYRERKEKRDRRSLLERNAIELIDVAGREALYRAARDLREWGGRAPGPDGIEAAEISPIDMGDVCDELANSIAAGNYRPQSTRSVALPKRNGGVRVLQLSNLRDRIVSRALYNALEPFMDQMFLKNSFGFRKRRGTWEMLAELSLSMQRDDVSVLAIDDVRQAFDNVPLEELQRRLSESQESLQSTQNHSVRVSEEVLRLAMTIATGEDVNNRTGLKQGCSWSPMALNLILHYAHDLPLQAEGLSSWFRYADNLVYPVQDVVAGQQLLERVNSRLQMSGLNLKGEDGVVDLAIPGTTADVLGFRVKLNTERQVVFLFGKDAWQEFQQLLLAAHTLSNPDDAAKQFVRGWIQTYGPAMVRREYVTDKIYHLLAHYGLREFSRESIGRMVVKSWRRWERLYHKISRRRQR